MITRHPQISLRKRRRKCITFYFSLFKRGKYDFDPEKFDAVSPHAKDFISRLIQRSRRRRLTAAQCLAHEWLTRSSFDENKRIKVDRTICYSCQRSIWFQTTSLEFILAKRFLKAWCLNIVYPKKVDHILHKVLRYLAYWEFSCLI